MKNKSFVFSITITEVIILLFFLITLLSTVKINKKIAEANKFKEVISEHEKTIRDLNIKIETQKVMILKLIENPKANDFFDELVNVQRYKTEIAKLKDENKRVKKILEDLNKEKKSIYELEEYTNKLHKEIESKKNLLTVLQKIKTIEDVKKIKNNIERSEELKKRNKELFSLVKDKDKSIVSLKEEIKNANEKNIVLTENIINMKGQVSFLNKKLNQKDGGNGLPPCWVNEKGSIEYLFFIEMYESKLNVLLHQKAKKSKAKKIKNLNRIVNKNHSLNRFMSLTRPIYNQSVKDECRHYVLIRDYTETKKSYKKKTLTIENNFYKYILRNN